MTTCPHCQAPVDLRTVPHHGLFVSYRTCPACAGTFAVDPATRTRQAWWLVLLVISLAMTLLLYFDGTGWLWPACITYLLLGVLMYRGNKRVYLVPAGEEQSR